MNDFFINCQAFSKQDLIDLLQEKKPINNGGVWIIKNEIKPVDLFCYLYSKYGPPNGLLTLFRNPKLGSSNLIQWDWMLKNQLGTLHIQGHNFRTEVFISDEIKDSNLKIEDFINQIKSDFKNYGKEISNTKKSLEKWTEFVNPFSRIKSTIDQHFLKLAELELDISQDKISNIFDLEDQHKWTEVTNKYYFAVGLIYGLRSMLPVMAESFINFLIFILGRPEIKSNQRLFDTTIRQPIDIRIQSLHLNCNFFIEPIDYTSSECKKFHTLMNERNDMLHGNINISKQSFGEVYFNRDMAIYDTYQDHWEKSIGILINSVKFESIHDDKKIVDAFIQYILSKIDPKVRGPLEELLNKSYLGFNYKTGRVGVLFSEQFSDFKVSAEKT